IGNPSLNHRYRKGFYSLFKTLQQNRLEYPLADTPAPSPKEMFALADQLARTVPHLPVTALTKTFIY
ncbi:hypothetical protein ABXM80_12910, partial [Enterococcus faecium]